MPSCQGVHEIVETDSTTTQDFLSRDVENLVSEIKENLRLSGLKMRPQKRARPSPYSNASRSNFNDLCCRKTVCDECSKKGDVSCPHIEDDPYEMLQDLLRDGSLIKEAVKRLQRLSPKQRYFYDSDDEANRSPYRYYRNLEI